MTSEAAHPPPAFQFITVNSVDLSSLLSNQKFYRRL